MNSTLLLLKQELKKLLSLSSTNCVCVVLWDMFTTENIVTNTIKCEYQFYRYQDIESEFDNLKKTYDLMSSKDFDIHIRIVIDKTFMGEEKNV